MSTDVVPVLSERREMTCCPLPFGARRCTIPAAFLFFPLLLAAGLCVHPLSAQQSRQTGPDATSRLNLSSGYSLVIGCIDGGERVVLLHGSDTIRVRRSSTCGSDRKELVADLRHAFVLGTREDSADWSFLEIVDKRTGRVRALGNGPLEADNLHEAFFFRIGNGTSIVRYDARSSRVTYFAHHGHRLYADDIITSGVHSILVAYTDSGGVLRTATVPATAESIVDVEHLSAGYTLTTRGREADRRTAERYLTIERGADTFAVHECDGLERTGPRMIADVDSAVALGWAYGQIQYCAIIDKPSGTKVGDGFDLFYSDSISGTMLWRSATFGPPETGGLPFQPVIVRYDSETRRLVRYAEPDDHYYLTGVPWQPTEIGPDNLLIDYVDGPDEHTKRVSLSPLSIEFLR